ncbi:microviridin/marinostatin family tricyclic proteinase inhibitor [Archangium violaceum]|uniref:microviridin/marinostatin family tricyclic proteinase inhibitor n=1 Tax=Archangium violaceum TaxID=83451 RepID=UPI00193B4DDD|nr:microviridin/marinostatin family tricyclic proteinase inhibitor [Archangium violaceum]QRK06362.1 microviridin/marinostatin family tricyclic proteinase inhibitor [Archangium violaceum]
MKKNAKDSESRKGKKPFFARLLETQELEQVAGGTGTVSKKYPSDSDECGGGGGGGGPIVTLKFPSDDADVSGY